jgi:hypothetical protein
MVSSSATRGLLSFAVTAVIACQGGKLATPFPDPEGEFDPAVADRIAALFTDIINMRHPPGDRAVKRAVFLKPHGCARAQFEVLSGLPGRFRTGLFYRPAKFDAWVRFSSDTIPITSDLRGNTIGFAIKLLGVRGPKILPGEEQATTHDFLLQNHQVFFVDTARDFLEFTETVFTRTTPTYLQQHPTTDAILKAMSKPVANVLGSTYWSTTPYRLGGYEYAKYKVVPCGELADEPQPAETEPNYLRARLERHLRAHGACFEFQVQLRQGTEMPLDRATVDWNEAVSQPHSVAVITIPPQEVTSNGRACENMSFTAWHALASHRPVGTVNRARGVVYKKLADLRRSRNGVPIAEPEE